MELGAGALSAEVGPGLNKVSGNVPIDFSRGRISPFIFIIPQRGLNTGKRSLDS